MTHPEDEFDPDDNFAHGFADGNDIDEDAEPEALVWQWLLLVNPGDEDAALLQFGAYREALELGGDDEEITLLLRDATDWKSTFHVEDGDNGTLVDAIVELAARFNLRIDWGVEDASDAEFLARTDMGTLVEIAYDQLRVDGYTLWTWDTGTDTMAGGITLTRDDDAMRFVAHALGIDARTGAG